MRVLRGDHKKRHGQRPRLTLDGDLFFFHRLEQGALCARAGAVDLVGQQHLGKHRAGVEHKTFLLTLVNRHAGQIAGHQIGSELHPRKLQAEGARQGVRQRGFSDAGHIFNQQMPAGQQAGHAVLDLRRLAHNDRVKLI